MKIGILGGTFDPIHLGHLSLARAAQHQFSLDKVLFVPAFLPPHKLDRDDVTPSSLRTQMVKLAISGIKDMELCTIEIEREGVSYTVDTLTQLTKRYSGAELYLIIGADSLHKISSWKDFHEIKRLARITVARRPGVALTTVDNILWIDMPELPLSSSLIRQKIKRKEDLQNMLPEDVAEFISRKKLYAAGS